MTSVTLNEDDGRYVVEAVGHATGSAQTCAAVSTLMFSVMGYLANADGVDVVNEDHTEGYFLIEFSGGDAARVIFEFLQIAFLQLEKKYGEFLMVKGISQL